MKYRCLRNCFINGQIYLKGEVHELPDSLRESTKFQALGQPPVEEPEVVEPATDATEKPREPKPGEFYCPKCNSIHREESKIGKRHMKFREVTDGR